jgi:predicted nucleic acid-binding protein
VKGIADTGFIIAFLNPNDRYHRWSVDVAAQITEPLLTAESVLAEAAYYLRNTAAVLALVENGMLRPALNLAEHLREISDLAERYADREPDLADLCIVRLSEMHPEHTVITVDSDFRVYRRNRREVIAVLMPSK